jgi:hypothetical protein
VYPVLNAAFFIFLISVIEIIYRVWLRCNKRELSIKSLKRDMSVNEFASEIFVKNKNLCVIDNQIIDFG